RAVNPFGRHDAICVVGLQRNSVGTVFLVYFNPIVDAYKAKHIIPRDGVATIGHFVRVNDGIKVHKKNCPNAISLQSNYAYRIMSAKWIDSTQEEFTVDIQITGIDNLGLVNEITNIISDNMHVNMRNLNFSADGGTFLGKITLMVKNNNILKKIMNNLKQVEGIDKVTRI
ncbi:MAG: ACT domain-containing protein, partial [Bacteroidota bacterium]